MSAYIVDRDHIAFLVYAAMYGGTHPNPFQYGRGEGWSTLRHGDRAEAERIGQMLWDENIRSVSHRYPGEGTDTLPGVDGEDYRFTLPERSAWGLEFFPAEVFQAIDCLIYQSCETEDFRESEAWSFLYALRVAYCRKVTGGEPTWGAPPTIAEKREKMRGAESWRVVGT